MISQIFKRSIKSLTIGTVIKYAIISVIITAIILVAFIAGFVGLFASFAYFSMDWLNWIIGFLGTFGAAFLAWFLFPLITPLIAGIFQDEICAAVEKSEYSKDPQMPNTPLFPNIWHEVKLVLFALFVNIILLPFYFIPLINLIIYYVVNSYFIGRGFFDIIATRYYGREQAKILRKEQFSTIMIIGFILVLMTNIPILNIFMPFVGTIVMLHTIKLI